MGKFRLCALIMITLFFSTGTSVMAEPSPVVTADPPPPVEQLSVQPPIKMVEPGVFEIGGCRIIKKENRVEFPAQVNMREGMLEYLVVGKAGKLHESLLKTDIEPYALQIALLLTGLEGTLNPLVEQGQSKTPEGDRVDVWLSWMANGKEKKERIEKFILKGKNSIKNEIPRVFTGSIVMDGVFLAQTEKSIIAVYHDPTALIDHQQQEGDNDEIWFADPAQVPSLGIDLTVIIEKKK